MVEGLQLHQPTYRLKFVLYVLVDFIIRKDYLKNVFRRMLITYSDLLLYMTVIYRLGMMQSEIAHNILYFWSTCFLPYMSYELMSVRIDSLSLQIFCSSINQKNRSNVYEIVKTVNFFTLSKVNINLDHILGITVNSFHVDRILKIPWIYSDHTFWINCGHIWSNLFSSLHNTLLFHYV